jgi:predicted DNA-binding transcriptional regulator AlpA
LTKHNLGVRADSIAGEQPNRHGDDLLDTSATANWLGVSLQFLTIGRVRGYGPKFVRFGPRRVMYKYSDVLAWLAERTHQSTAEYSHEGKKPGRPRKVA